MSDLSARPLLKDGFTLRAGTVIEAAHLVNGC